MKNCKVNPSLDSGWKVTFLFEQTNVVGSGSSVSAGRQSGWSESWYFPDVGFSSTLLTRASNIAIARCALLNRNAKIVEIRLKDLSSNQVLVNPVTFGGLGPACDIPQMALLVLVQSADSFNRRLVELRGIPDDWVSGGELSPGAASAAFSTWRTSLVAQGAYFSGLDKTIPRFGVQSVVAAGNIITLFLNEPSTGIAPDLWLRFYRVKPDATCCGSICDAQVTGVTSPTIITARQNGAVNASGGKVGVRPDLELHPLAGDPFGPKIERVVTRKVGRPFDAFSGRKKGSCCR